MQEYKLNEKVLDIQGVCLKLGGRQILRDVSYVIRNITRPGLTTGQVVAILGPSGIGKTKLFEIIAGLRRPDAGQVLLNEAGNPVTRGQVGVVFQNYPLYEHRTVLGNLIKAGRQRPVDPQGNRLNRQQISDKAIDLLQRFGLGSHARFYPAQLSGGQRQRVAIAQQLMCSDHFMLMDEPFSGLDPNMIEEVCRIIQLATNRDDLNTTIVVTHDVTAAVSIADIILLMGWEKDPTGKFIDGATIIEMYDSMEMGLAWREGIATTPECAELVRNIKARFKDIKR